MERVDVRVHPADKNDVKPLLVSFPQGPPPPNTFSDGPDETVVYSKKDSKRGRQYMVRMDVDGVKFEGKTDRSAELRKVAKFAIGVFDKDVKQLKIIPAAGLCALRCVQAHREASNTLRDVSSVWDRKRALIDTYGSKKARQVKRAREDARIDEGSVTAASAISSIITTSALAARKEILDASGALVGGVGGGGSGDGSGAAAQLAAVAARRERLPPYNEDATTVEHVFPLDSLISSEESSAIAGEVTATIKLLKKPSLIQEAREERRFHPYIQGQLEQLATLAIPRKDARLRCRALLILSYYLKLHLARDKLSPRMPVESKPAEEEAAGGEGAEGGEADKAEGAGEAKDGGEAMEGLEGGEGSLAAMAAPHLLIPALSSVPEPVIEKLLRTFAEESTSDSGRTTWFRTPMLKDKLLVYIACLALTANNFSMSINNLARAVKLSPKKFIAYFRELGCTYKTLNKTGEAEKKRGASDRVYHATLTLPLQFPKVKRPAKRS